MIVEILKTTRRCNIEDEFNEACIVATSVYSQEE